MGEVVSEWRGCRGAKCGGSTRAMVLLSADEMASHRNHQGPRS